MKTRYLFALLVLTAVCLRGEAINNPVHASSSDTLLVVRVKAEPMKDTVFVQSTCPCKNSRTDIDSLSHTDDIPARTLEVNAFNNVLTHVNNLITTITIVIGVIGLIVAILGIAGFSKTRKDFEKQIDKLCQDFNNHKEEINREITPCKDDAKNLKQKYEEIEKKQSLNNQYMQHINQWMLYNANAIAETAGGGSDTGRNMMTQSQVYYYLMKLFLTDDPHEIDGCINYIKTKADQDEIEHLQFIVDKDTNAYKRQKAGEAIGYIRGRFTNA